LLEKAADSVSKQKGSGSFDFKRYKRRIAGEEGGDGTGNSIKKRLHSTMGPSIATESKIPASEPASKRKRKTTISSSNRGKKRVDTLGAY
jgi:hypothetical protein